MVGTIGLSDRKSQAGLIKQIFMLTLACQIGSEKKKKVHLSSSIYNITKPDKQQKNTPTHTTFIWSEMKLQMQFYTKECFSLTLLNCGTLMFTLTETKCVHPSEHGHGHRQCCCGAEQFGL